LIIVGVMKKRPEQSGLFYWVVINCSSLYRQLQSSIPNHSVPIIAPNRSDRARNLKVVIPAKAGTQLTDVGNVAHADQKHRLSITMSP